MLIFIVNHNKTYKESNYDYFNEKVLVYPNGTMWVQWDVNTQIGTFTHATIPMPTGVAFKKLAGVTRTKAGVTAIMLKCTEFYTGDNCEIPICAGRNALDPLVCYKRGWCVAPNKCACDAFNTGDSCSDLSPTSIAMITIASILASMQIFITCTCIGACACYYGTKVTRKIVNQRKAEIEMKSLLRESLLNIEQLSDQVDRDWVISLEEIKITEKLAEGAFGVVFKGRYRNADV